MVASCPCPVGLGRNVGAISRSAWTRSAALARRASSSWVSRAVIPRGPATHGERGVQLVYYAFDLLHLGGWDVSNLQLIERKALLEPLVANMPAARTCVSQLWRSLFAASEG